MNYGNYITSALESVRKHYSHAGVCRTPWPQQPEDRPFVVMASSNSSRVIGRGWTAHEAVRNARRYVKALGRRAA